jgi:hypothetical protein
MPCDCEENYGDARRHFWQAAFCAALTGALADGHRFADNGARFAKNAADAALQEWEVTWTRPAPPPTGTVPKELRKPKGGFHIER